MRLKDTAQRSYRDKLSFFVLILACSATVDFSKTVEDFEYQSVWITLFLFSAIYTKT